MMTTYERRQSLLLLLQKQVGIRVPELAEALQVSIGTIRNDLSALEDEGLLRRVHGGAVLLNALYSELGSSFNSRYQENVAAKLSIARTAAGLVKDGDSILLDASTTINYLARHLAHCHHLRVITNGMDVARLLAKDPSNTVVLIGGVVTPDGSSVTGSLSEQIIRDLRVQKAFVSCSGFSLQRGLTDVLLAEAELKAKAVMTASELIALIDSSKMGKEDLTAFASVEQISQIFTDDGLTTAWAEQLNAAGIRYTICPAD
jgi:DeoR/GlpR family transcriptional regulator of sugar metabolism